MNSHSTPHFQTSRSGDQYSGTPVSQWPIASKLSLGAIVGLVAVLGLIVKWKLAEKDLAWAEVPSSKHVLSQSPDEAGLPPAQLLDAKSPLGFQRSVSRAGWETSENETTNSRESSRFSGIRFAGHEEHTAQAAGHAPSQLETLESSSANRMDFPAPHASEPPRRVRSLFDGPEEVPANVRMMPIESAPAGHSEANRPAPLPTLDDTSARPIPSGTLTPSMSLVENNELHGLPTQAETPRGSVEYQAAPAEHGFGEDPFSSTSAPAPQQTQEVAELPRLELQEATVPDRAPIQQTSGFDPALEAEPTPAGEPAPFQLQPTPIKETPRTPSVDELDLEADWPAQRTTTPPEGFGGNIEPAPRSVNQYEEFGSLDIEEFPSTRETPAAIPASSQNNNYFQDSTAVQQPPTPDDDLHEVQSGDNYWTISKRYYGTARFFGALAEYNKPRIADPNKMKPGMFVLVPDLDVLYERYPKLTGADPRKISPADTRPGFFVDRDGQPSYRVGKGDTLTDIAQNHLGRSSRWTQIYAMNRNRIPKTEALKIGTVLRLPTDASQVVLAPRENLSR